MSNNNCKFEVSLIDYCTECMNKAYTLFEDQDIDNGLYYLGHATAVLGTLNQSRNRKDEVNINEFVAEIVKFPEDERGDVWTHMLSHGFSQFIPE